MKTFALDVVGDTTSSVHTVGSLFSPHALVFGLERKGGTFRSLDLSSTLQVTKGWRDAILAHSNGLSDRARELLSGHTRDGSNLHGPHLAFLPIADVGQPHANGRLLGMALTLPAHISADDRREALCAVTDVRHLALGRLGKWKVVTDADACATWDLRPEAWIAHPDGATHWSTVTPFVFDRHPKAKSLERYQQEVVAMIRKACTRIGLREPREAIVTQVSALYGVPPSFAFPRLTRKDGSERRHTHAILVFGEPVCGPMLVGAGRYRGYGFCRPMSGEDLGDEGRTPSDREGVRMAPR